VIDPRLDLLVWASLLLFLLLLGARAWAVETAEARHYRTSARVRVLTGATALAFVALVGMVAMQGGIVFVEAVVTRTDPETLVTVVGEGDNTDEAVADPDVAPAPAAPADPNAPAAPAPVAPAPGAPPAGGAPAAPPAAPGG
jgi:hypothetical protein